MREGSTVYLAGPMTGIPEFNYPAFHEAAKKLRTAGFTVINPAEVNPDTTLSWEECMKRDLVELMKCGMVAVLPDWHKSRGARLEVHVAASLGMAVHPVGTLLAQRAEELEAA
jgi:hypothetical protein